MLIKKVSLNEVWEIRHKVMWPGKDLSFVQLADDPIGLHLGLYTEERLVSVISLFLEGNQAQFRKFATLQQEQGRGYGSKLLEHTMNEAKRLGADRIWCNARRAKLDFYRKFGLVETDRAFEKQGVDYIILEKYM